MMTVAKIIGKIKTALYGYNPSTSSFEGIAINPTTKALQVDLTTNAKNITIEDAGGYYTGTDVEAALQEIGSGATLDNRYVNVTGDTMTGTLTITPSADSTSVFKVTNAAGTSVLNVDTKNGYVGIGTASPISVLHISRTTSNTILKLSNPTTGYSSIIDLDSGTSTVTRFDEIYFRDRGAIKWRIRKDSSNEFDIYSDVKGASVLHIKGDGRIGIGTTAPAGIMHIKSSGSQTTYFEAGGGEDDYVTFQFWQNGSANRAIFSRLQANHPNYPHGFYVSNIVNSATKNWFLLNGNGDIIFAATANFRVYAGSYERLRIDTSGNVGIGTTSPATRLDIANGAITIKAMTAPTSPATDSAVLYVEASGTSPTRTVALKVKFEDGTVVTLASTTV